jgi:deoxyadenosine/deoxycytidine kinase
MSKYTISIEANIGVGKSTFLENISKYYNDEFNTITEPLDDWLHKFSDVDNNILGLLYENQDRWAYTFQHNAFLTRVQKVENEYDPKKINITERSVLSDYNVFAKMLKDDKKLNEIEWKIYINWMEFLLSKFDVKPNLIVYLKLDPEVAFERIKKRHRDEESTIPFEYIKRLHEYHENWIMNEVDIPIVVLDASKDFKNNNKVLDEFVKIIKTNIKSG